MSSPVTSANPTENPFPSERYWRANGMRTQFREIAPVARKHGLGVGRGLGRQRRRRRPDALHGGDERGRTREARGLRSEARGSCTQGLEQGGVRISDEARRVPPPAPKKPGAKAPTWVPKWKPFKLSRPPMRGDNVKVWQGQMGKRGWDIVADGVYGARSATVARAFQREHRLYVDGVVGAATWRAAWERPVL